MNLPLSEKCVTEIPVFANFNETECRQLSEISRQIELQPGQLLLRQGENTQNLWIVLDGKCEVVRDLAPGGGGGVVLAELGQYSVIGEMSFFHKAMHSASVRAKTSMKLMRIARSDFDELIQDGASAAYKLAFNAVASMAERLRHMDQWVAQLLAEGSAAQRKDEWDQFRERLFSASEL